MDAAAAPPIGALLGGRYRLGPVIGRGGWSVVYRARDETLRRDVAVKMYVAGRGDPAAEARAAARLAHPNFPRVFDIGTSDGWPFLVMELIEGRSAQVLVAEAGPLPPARAVALVAQLADAVQVAHERGGVHADIKPSNVVVGDDGAVKLVDLGEATFVAQTGNGPAVGDVAVSPLYAAPEVTRGERPSPASDIYALGALLYTLLTARPPTSGAASVDPLTGRGPELAPPSHGQPTVSPALDAAVRRAMATDPAQRFPSAAAFALALRATDGADPEATRVLRPVVTRAAPTPVATAAAEDEDRIAPTAQRIRRRLRPLALAAGALLVLALLGWLAWPWLAPAPFCERGQRADLLTGLGALRDRLGASEMGSPVECGHLNAENGDLLQATSRGLAFVRKATSLPSFTNGHEHWALAAGDLLYWGADPVDPPRSATIVPGQPGAVRP